MKSSRVLTGAIVAGALAVASMFAAAPASAATLPDGAKITVIDDDGEQFYNVSPSTAVATPVGTPSPDNTDIAAVDVDDQGLGYAIGNTDPSEEDEFGAAWLFKADANTGTLSEVKQVLIDDDGDVLAYANECTALDYSSGVITAVCYTWGGGEIGYVGTIDASGENAVLDTDTKLWEQDGSWVFFTAIAIDPTDGTIYGFSFDQGTANLWTITLDGADPALATDEPYYYIVEAADFDRGGQLWLSIDPITRLTALVESYVLLATYDFTELEIVPVDNFASEEPYEIDDPNALTVWGLPALAATGSVGPVAPAAAAGAVLLLGAILAAGTLVLRRRQADA